MLVSSISSRIRPQFPFPEQNTRFRHRCVSASLVSVPETSVNEYNSSVSRQDNVRFSRKILSSERETVPNDMEEGADDEFRFGVLRPDTRHVPTAPFLCQSVRHFRIIPPDRRLVLPKLFMYNGLKTSPTVSTLCHLPRSWYIVSIRECGASTDKFIAPHSAETPFRHHVFPGTCVQPPETFRLVPFVRHRRKRLWWRRSHSRCLPAIRTLRSNTGEVSRAATRP